MAYGSPNSLDEVGPYLSQVRGGREPTPEAVERLREKYRQVGGRTPLLQVTLAQAKRLEEKLTVENLRATVYVGMKHWHPFIEETVLEIVKNGATSIIGIALAPHYSKLSIGGYEDHVVRGLAKHDSKIPFTMVKKWHTEETLIRAFSKRVTDSLRKMKAPENATVLFTAHSLPKNAVAPEDPYQSQLLETTKLVASNTGVKHWSFAFQSA